MTPKRSRSSAQRKAEQRHDDKRRGRPRLPASRLTDEEGDLLDAAAALFEGDKKTAILTALRELLARGKGA